MKVRGMYLGALAGVVASPAAWAAVDAPVFLPAEGDSPVVFPVTVTCATSGATIHYTLNGSEPTVSDPIVASGSPVTITRNLTLKAKAWTSTETSATTTALYHVTGDIAAGSHHVLSLSSAGAIKAWGEQASGRLGNIMTASADVISPVASKYGINNPITDAIAIGAGQNHSLFISKSTGGSVNASNAVWAFGNNASGELGDDTTTNREYAVRVKKDGSPLTYLNNCVMVRCGENFSGALGLDGKVYMWGSQGGGRLGNGSTLGNKKYAVNVQTSAYGNPHLTGIVSLSLGSGFALARDGGSLGHVWSWGQGGAGRLGQGDTLNKDYAAKVKLDGTANNFLTGAWDVSAGGSHSVVVRKTAQENNTVWAFGDATAGRLGNNNATDNKIYPVQVKKYDGTNLEDIQMVAAGSAHTLALDGDGGVWAWGYNGYGAIGDNNAPTNALRAVKVLSPTGSTQLGRGTTEGKIVWIAAGGDGNNNTSFAISEKGVVYAWGRNDDGEMGNGQNTGWVDRPAAVPNLKLIPGHPVVGLTHTVNQGIAPGNVTLTATPSDPDLGATFRVDFYAQGEKKGDDTTGPYEHVLTNLAAGTYHVYAVVTDNDQNTGYSSPVTFTIGSADPNSDADGDGLTYAREVAIGTNPDDPDHDDDKVGDGYEDYYGLDPVSAANGGGANAGPGEHKDTDGMTNKDEADRGRIPTSSTESPAITGTFPASVAKWFGVEGVTYHFEYSTDQITWTRHPVPLAGDNAELSLPIANVVSTLPVPFATRVVTESNAPDATLTVEVPAVLAPGAASLKVNPVDSDGAGDIASVEFRVEGYTPYTRTAPPWNHTFTGLAAGTHQASAIVTDLSQKRGFADAMSFSILSPTGDSDSDGLPDGWEVDHFGSLAQGGAGDPDGDGLPNSGELVASTDPMDGDSDDDKMGDGYEAYYALDPMGAVNGAPNHTGPADHKDNDTLSNKDEADRGRIPDSETESPDFTGSFPNLHAKWFGVEGVTYHFEYTTAPATWTRHPVPLTGHNAELLLPISTVVSSLPVPFNTRLVTESDAPEVSLATEITGLAAPGAVLLTATPADPDGAEDIASIEFLLNGNSEGTKISDPWTYQITGLASGDHAVQAIVSDQDGKRGFSQIVTINIQTPGLGGDGDELPDEWEMQYFNSLTRTPAGDEDGDQLSNLDEYLNGTNPNQSDTDGDGLNDYDELLYGTRPWEPDSDGDGLSDYDELFVYGTLPNNPDSDGDGMRDDWEVNFGLNPMAEEAFPDVDGDGLLNDEEQSDGGDPKDSDTDNDGILDGEDLYVNDAQINWARPPVPLYAEFPLANSSNQLAPLHLNATGMVLFGDSVRVDAVSHPLPMSSATAIAARAIGMNDMGQILGIGFRLPPQQPGGSNQAAVPGDECLVWWTMSYDELGDLVIDGPIPVVNGDDQEGQDVCWSYYEGSPTSPLGSRFPWDRVLDNQGRFVANRDIDIVGQPLVRKVWQRTANGFGELEATGDNSLFAWSNGGTGYSYGPGASGSEIWTGGNLDSTVSNVVTRLGVLPNGIVTAAKLAPFRPMLKASGGWQVSPLFGGGLVEAGSFKAFPLAAGGTTLYQQESREKYPRPWNKMAPGSTATGVEHLDIAGPGWLLSKTGETGHLISLPVVLGEEAEASGIDHVSVTSSSPGAESQDRAWVMTPVGDWNGFDVLSGANYNARIVMEAPGIPLISWSDLLPGATPDGRMILDAPTVNMIADGRNLNPAMSGTEVLATFKWGTTQATSKPVGFYIMKPRTVRVLVYKVEDGVLGGNVNTPAHFPTKDALEDYLNEVYSSQINVTFQVQIASSILVSDYSGSLVAGGVDEYSEDQQDILDEIPATGEPAADIRVFIVGGVNPIDGKNAGSANKADRTCWVYGNTYVHHNSPEDVVATVAHEIGHIIVGYGHPDEERADMSLNNPAPLPHTNRAKRLMGSGTLTGGAPGKLLVKAEWEKAETNLNELLATP